MLMLIITEILEIRNLKIAFFFKYFPHLLLHMIGIACIHSTMFSSGSVRLSQVVKDAATLHGLELGEEVGVRFRHRSLLLHLHIAFNIIGKVVFIILVKSSLLEPRKQIQIQESFVILLKYSFHS